MKAIQLRYKEKENEQQRQNKARPEKNRPGQDKTKQRLGYEEEKQQNKTITIKDNG
jgi:hypothetical protein